MDRYVDISYELVHASSGSVVNAASVKLEGSHLENMSGNIAYLLYVVPLNFNRLTGLYLNYLLDAKIDMSFDQFALDVAWGRMQTIDHGIGETLVLSELQAHLASRKSFSICTDSFVLRFNVKYRNVTFDENVMRLFSMDANAIKKIYDKI